MKKIRIADEVRQSLINKRIISVGDDYIELTNGLRIYLDENEIEMLGSEPIREANYWVIETGSDCDGVYTRGRVWAFETQDEAYEYSDKQHEWSDGMKYPVLALFSSVVDYCNDHNLNPENYKQP
jgi:hypothetical protein